MKQTNIIDLGKVGITVEKNLWNSSTFYERLTMVRHKESGNTYVSVEDNVNRDPSKDDGSNWILASSNGLSIYELMVARGKYTGTEEQFLADYNKVLSDATAAATTATAAATTANTAKTAALAAADEANEAKAQAAAATKLCEDATANAEAATARANTAAANAEGIKTSLDNFIAQGGGATDAQVIKNTEDIAKLGLNISELGNFIGSSKEFSTLNISKHSYLRWNDNKEVEHQNYSISEPIHLNCGDYVEADVMAFNSQASIVLTDKNNIGKCSKLVQGVDDSALSLKKYCYKADKECYVAFSGYNDSFPINATIIRNSEGKLLSNTANIVEDYGFNAVDVETTYKVGSIANDLVINTSVTVCQYSSPIKLNAGDKIRLFGVDSSIYGMNAFDSYWTIALCDADGNLIEGIVGSKIAEIVEYKTDVDCYVIFSVRSLAFVKAVIYKSAISCEISDNKQRIIEVENSHRVAIDKLDKGYYDSYAEIGGITSLQFTEVTGWYSKKISVKKGDVFYVTGKGGETPLLWVNCDNGKKVYAKSEQNALLENKRIEIAVDGYLVCNFNNANSYELYKVELGKINILDIDYYTRLPKLHDNPLHEIRSLGLAGIVHDWGFIGDSLMSGLQDNKNVSQYDYSWGQRMCKLLGVDGYNFSVGGMTTKSWIYNRPTTPFDENRIWKGAKTNIKKAYVIGLGVNDRAELVTHAEGYYEVGNVSTDIGTYSSATDTDTNANTFVGYYSGIIQRIRSVAPNAPIFVITIPVTGSRIADYNTAIRNIAQEFADSNVFVIDLDAYASNFEDKTFRALFIGSGHLTLIGYEYVAYVMMQYIDWIIRNNISAFKNLNL